MANGYQPPQPPAWQQMYRPGPSGLSAMLGGATPMFSIPWGQPTPWGQYFTPEGVPLYEQTGQTLSDLLARRTRMQEVGGYAGGTLSAQIAELQRQEAAQRGAYQTWAGGAANIFPYQTHYAAEGLPLWQQTEQEVQALVDKKNRLMAVGGYTGHLDAQIANLNAQMTAQKQQLSHAEEVYRAGGLDAWNRRQRQRMRRGRPRGWSYARDGGGDSTGLGAAEAGAAVEAAQEAAVESDLGLGYGEGWGGFEGWGGGDGEQE